MQMENGAMDEQERLILKMLASLMETQQLTQRALGEKLAEITGAAWTQQKVWKVLNGRIDLTVDMLLKLCQAFGVSLVELLVRAQALREMPPEVREYLSHVQGGTRSPLIVILSPPEPATEPAHDPQSHPHVRTA